MQAKCTSPIRRAEPPCHLCATSLLFSTGTVSVWGKGNALALNPLHAKSREKPHAHRITEWWEMEGEISFWSVLTALLPRPHFLAPGFSLPTASSLLPILIFSPLVRYPQTDKLIKFSFHFCCLLARLIHKSKAQVLSYSPQPALHPSAEIRSTNPRWGAAASSQEWVKWVSWAK